MKRIGTAALLLMLGFGLVQCTQKKSTEQQVLTKEEILNESKEAFNNRMQWWRDATFGMFIHWGAYAVPAGTYKGKKIENCTGEWIMNCAHIPVEEYEEYARQFNPVKYDPGKWVQIAKDAGMKYLIITSKHHDGFALYDSDVSNYDAVDFASVHKDLLDGLKKAADKAGIKLGFYYSIMDWHHPDAQAPNYPNYNTDEKANPHFDRYVEDYLKPQIRELVRKYDPAVLWFDGEWIPEWKHEYAVEIYTMLRQMNPDIIINNRVDVGRNGMQGMNKGKEEYVGDFGTPEQEILNEASDYDWEACMTMNDTWGYKAYDDNWKSVDSLIYNLADIAAKGGNYLLNVGPTAEGLIPQASVERLEKMGNWLDVNGEAIYSTERLQNHFEQGRSIRYTKRKDEPVYYGILLQNVGESLTLEYVQPESNSEIHLLGYDRPLEWRFEEGEGTTIEIPSDVRKNPEFQFGTVFKIQGKEVG